ncbi:MAG: hypothetical protein R6V03_07570 [Kiritimatiellia bacterium]
MADIQITCPDCSAVTTVSEFADDSSLVCRNCGQKLQKPAYAGSQKQKKKPGLRTRQTAPAPPPSADTSSSAPPEPTQMDLMGPAPRRRKKFRFTHNMGSWLVFLVLGGTMGALRYGGLAPQTYIFMVREYALWIAVVLDLMILLKAFKDSVFQGILCLLIPPYALYYLFTTCDDFYLRAIIGGLLVGLGQDCFVAAGRKSANLIDFISEWIATGGGG